MIQVFIFLNRKYKIIWYYYYYYYYYYSLLTHQASERRENKFSTKKYISICEILVVTTLMLLIYWDGVGMRRFQVWFQQKENEGEKKTIKEISVFKLPTIGGLNRHHSTRSKIVHPKLGMLTLYTIPEHIKVATTENREILPMDKSS